MDELLPVPKMPSSQEQILALMAALGQHLVPDYLKEKTGPFPMEPNAAGKVPPIGNSPFETAGAGMFDLATLLPGGALKPVIAGATGMAAKPGLSGLLKQLVATGKEPVKQTAKLAPHPQSTSEIDAWVDAALKDNPGASIFDVANVKAAQTVPTATSHWKSIIEGLNPNTKNIPIEPFDWASLTSKHAADVQPSQKSPEEIAKLGFNPNFPLFKGGKRDYSELPDPGTKDYERALFFSDKPKIAEEYGSVLPFIARAENPAQVDWSKVSKWPAHNEATMDAIVNAARERGHDFLKVSNIDDIGGMQDQYLLLHPHLARAPHAAFDPAKLNENNVLAGLAAGGFLTPLLKQLDLMGGLQWKQ
jgi:hypothetical protein